MKKNRTRSQGEAPPAGTQDPPQKVVTSGASRRDHNGPDCSQRRNAKPRQRKSEINLDMAKEKRNTSHDLRGGPCLRLSLQLSPLHNLRCLSFLNALNIAQTIGPQSLPGFAMARAANWTSVVRWIALRRAKMRIVQTPRSWLASPASLHLLHPRIRGGLRRKDRNILCCRYARF